MADSNSSRSPRADDPQPRSVDDSLRGSDPLAELARLIGQSDPFADFEGGRVRGEAQDGGRTPAVPPEDWPPPAASPEPHHHGAGAPQAAPEDIAYPPPGYAPPGPAEPYAPYPDEAYGYPAEAYQEGEQPYYEPYYDPDDSFEEADYLEEHDRKRRRTRLAAVAAVLALVILGGAGAYGYRTFFGTAMQDAPPPVIKADTTPAKVIPEARGSGSGSNKLIYDRVGQNQGGEEKIVPREEKPVDIKTATVTPPASAAAPSASANAVAAPPPVTIPVTGQSPSGQVLPVASEPTIAARGTGAILPSAKKVRTVTIRPSDMTIVPESAARTAEPEPPPAPQSAQPPEPPAPPERSAARAPAPSPAPSPPPPQPTRQVVNTPLSLSPEAVSSAPPRAPAGAAAAPSPTRQPMALATAPAATSGEPRATSGGFTVQVSSQRTEAEAEAAYRTLQARYPSVLGGHASFVRRADLGSRGIYYRTLVGPFGTAEQAGQLCGSLKAAGGQCIIHRN